MRFIIRLFIFIMLLLSISSASIENGIAWLTQQTQTKENLEQYTYISTPFQAANETFLTLYDLNASYESIYSPVSELNTTEELSRLIIFNKLEELDTTLLLTQLLTHQNEDGGFGELQGYDSNVLDTAYALKSLAVLNVNEDIVNNAIRYLKREQQVDGSWVDYINSDHIFTTLVTLESLYLVKDTQDVFDAMILGKEYVFEQGNSSQLLENIYLQALTVKSLLPLVTDRAVLQKNIDLIKEQQDNDGSWDQDIYTTSLALYSLNAYETKAYDLPQVSLGKTQIKGAIKDALTGTYLSNVRVSLSGANVKETYTDQSGQYIFDTLDTGITTINFTLTGYQGLELTTKLNSDTLYTLDRSLTKLSMDGNSNISIEGEVRDILTGEPLVGVNIVLTGFNERTIMSDNNGKYRFEHLSSGITNIQFQLDGYETGDESLDLQNNTAYTYNKTLSKILTTASVNIIGGIVSLEDKPLPNVKIELVDQYLDTYTNIDGVYRFESLTLKEGSSLQLLISADNYKTKTTFIDIKNLHAGINEIVLNKIVLEEGNLETDNNNTNNQTGQVSSSVSGIIRDEKGNPLVNVKVSLPDSSAVTYSDTNGHYNITKIYSAGALAYEDYQFSIIFSLNGYITDFKRFKTDKPINTNFDIILYKVDDSNVTIESILLDQNSYDAYSPVLMFINIKNMGLFAKKVNLSVDIVHDGIIVDSLTEDVQGNSLNDILSIPNIVNEKEIKWFTGIYPPGEYTFVAKITDENNTLSEYVSDFIINPTTNIESLNIKSSEKMYYIGESQEIIPHIKLINYSNVQHSLKFSYFVVSPKGESSSVYSKDMEIKPLELLKSMNIDPMNIDLREDGIYTIHINVIEGVQPKTIDSNEFIVLPAVHISPEQDIEPKMIVPENGQKIRIKIKIFGEQ